MVLPEQLKRMMMFLNYQEKGQSVILAPEIFKGMQYSFDVDIYSLGIVMYRLLNHNSLPFMPQPPAKPTYQDVSNANQLRMSGKTYHIHQRIIHSWQILF